MGCTGGKIVHTGLAPHAQTHPRERSRLCALSERALYYYFTRAFLLHLCCMSVYLRAATQNKPTCAVDDEGCGELHGGRALRTSRAESDAPPDARARSRFRRIISTSPQKKREAPCETTPSIFDTALIVSSFARRYMVRQRSQDLQRLDQAVP